MNIICMIYTNIKVIIYIIFRFKVQCISCIPQYVKLVSTSEAFTSRSCLIFKRKMNMYLMSRVKQNANKR